MQIDGRQIVSAVLAHVFLFSFRVGVTRSSILLLSPVDHDDTALGPPTMHTLGC